MNTGQMMLTVGAMVLLSIMVLRVNSSQMTSYGTIVDSKLGIVGLTVANTYVDFAKRQVYDKAVRDSTISGLSLADLTAPSSLGFESGEVYPNFDDIDDFDLWDPNHGVSIIITDTTTLASATHASVYTPFYITSQVYYVDQPNFDTKVNYKTWFKRLVVKVWADGMIDTIKYSSISTTW
jgi:hypothetical protein